MRDRKVLKLAIKDGIYRRRFLLPNSVTLASMFCGFLACIYSSQGHFGKACIAIAIASILDGLDGRVARRFNATSQFGVEFDSFADVISFGIAPAFLAYQWAFAPLAEKFGVVICFPYLLCAASRLARFNIDDANLKGFTGLPTPGAAALVISYIFLNPKLESSWLTLGSTGLLLLCLSYLMVSRVSYSSIKLLRVEKFTLKWKLAIGGAIALIWYETEIGFFVVAAAYVLSGLITPFFTDKSKDTGAPESVTDEAEGA